MKLFIITSTKNKLDVTVDSLLDELPSLTDGEIRNRIEFYESIGRDDLVKILKKEIDTPKNVKQVAGVKVDISDSDLEKINSSVKKRGIKNWGMVDGKSNIPIYEEIVVNGDKVYFSFNQKGPLIKKSNLPAWVDSVEIEAREAMQLGITPFGDIPPNFLPNYIEKFKEQLKLNPENTKGLKFEDVYFNYPVSQSRS